MTRRPPHERPSARKLAAEAAGEQPMQIAGKPADVCPYCGCTMFADGTRRGDSVTFRYVVCKKPRGCGRTFYSKQPPATIIREVGAPDDNVSSSSGQSRLTVHRQVG